MNKFEQLGLNESLLLAIKDLGFENPSEVKEKAIPILLEKDTDIVALAQTGVITSYSIHYTKLYECED